MTELDEKFERWLRTVYLRTPGELKLVKDAWYAGIRAFAEQEPSEEMAEAFSKSWQEITMPAQKWPQRLHDAYGKMMAEAIEALP